MFWLTSKAKQGKAKDSDGEDEDSDGVKDDSVQHDTMSCLTEKLISDISAKCKVQKKEDEVLTERIQQAKYELERCKQLGREADGRRVEEQKRLQSTLNSRRRKLNKTFQAAKSNISYFEYCRIIRESFDGIVAQADDRGGERVRSKAIHHSWYGWCEGFLLRGIHHAMITKDQLDIVQRNCNALLMDVYADCIPQMKIEKETVEKNFTIAIIQMEQYLARRQHFQRHCLDLRQQLLLHYGGQNIATKVGPPASSPHTPQSGNPSKGILKNTTGKSTSRWEEDTMNNAGLSPPARRQLSASSFTDDDDDDDDSNGAKKETSKIPVASTRPMSTTAGFVVYPPGVYAVP